MKKPSDKPGEKPGEKKPRNDQNLISSPRELEALTRRLKEAGCPVALDTEFLSERRYLARLCLVQVCCKIEGECVEAVVDPLAVSLKPFISVLEDPAIVKIVHAGAQDLQILYQDYQCHAAGVFDTQIAAAFLGYGHQAGYADLVRRLAGGPPLAKHLQYTDWSARPLTSEQMQYALDDVRYLPRLYATLRGKLLQRGRLNWAEAEFRRAEVRGASPPPPEELFRRLNQAGLNRRQLGALRELAMVRDQLARQIDKPPSFVVPDQTLVQMAKQGPASVAEIKNLRGMPSLPASHLTMLLEAVDHARDMPDEELPRRLHGERPDPRAEAVAALLGVVAQARATEQEISRNYLAPREQLAALANWWLKNGGPPPDLPVLEDWRHELLGGELLELLQGRVSLALDQSAPASERASVVRVLPHKAGREPKGS